MAYTILLSKKAEADIVKLRKAGEKKTLKKIDALLDELEQHPTTGTGHPKLLGEDRAGQWSRRITQKHRLVCWCFQHGGIMMISEFCVKQMT